MNVLYVVDSTTVSGAENVMLQYVDAFRAPQHATHVFLDARNRRLQDALDSRGIRFTPSANFSRRILRTTANPLNIAQFLRAFVRVSREIQSLLRAKRIDILHSISYPASLYAAFPARREGVPQVWHEHNIKRPHLANTVLYRFAASTCVRVVGPSRAVTTNLARFGIPVSKLVTVYNGIDLERFRPDPARTARVRDELGLLEGQPSVALLGQMLPYKGHATFIESVRRLVGQFPQLRAFLVGALENPPYQAELEQQITCAGLSEVVRFTGWRQDVPDVIRAMDAVVVATTTPEPAALALMETMAMGRPVAATRTGGTPEIVLDGETGFLFAPGDDKALADCLTRLLTDSETRERMGQAGRRRVEDQFTVAQHLCAVRRLYQSAHHASHTARDACASS
jgi:glycosyltransferase involved in cell wall biosynthesis